MGIFGRRRVDEEPGVIDLREPQESAIRHVWGLPSPCPHCHEPGYLDHIDPNRGVMFEHCPSCWATWEISRADIEASTGP
jgi:hypothetical protein